MLVDKCPPEELHCLQGFVNHTFYKGYAKDIGLERALESPKLINDVATDYHNNVFEGNAYNEMLKKADIMADRRILGDRISPLRVFKYIEHSKQWIRLLTLALVLN